MVVVWRRSMAEAVFLILTTKFVGTALALAAVLETEKRVVFSSKPVTLTVAAASLAEQVTAAPPFSGVMVTVARVVEVDEPSKPV